MDRGFPVWGRLAQVIGRYGEGFYLWLFPLTNELLGGQNTDFTLALVLLYVNIHMHA